MAKKQVWEGLRGEQYPWEALPTPGAGKAWKTPLQGCVWEMLLKGTTATSALDPGVVLPWLDLLHWKSEGQGPSNAYANFLEHTVGEGDES